MRGRWHKVKLVDLPLDHGWPRAGVGTLEPLSRRSGAVLGLLRGLTT